jgi:branched-chain amino acid transport system substrate-binding protein
MTLHRTHLHRLVLGAAMLSLAGLSSPALSQTPVKIGMITTLSGTGGYLGQDIRDGFKLAMDREGGKLGGNPVELMVEDDALKPGQGKQIADRMMTNDKVKLFTGIVFSNVAGAVVPDILDADGIFVSANAGPSNFAGKECHPNYFVISWLTDTMQGSAGQNATDLGYKRAFILAPNYQGGKDALDGFKRFFKGQVIGEIYTRLDQTDFAAEMAQIRAAKPDVVFQFHPGGLGITFLRQYRQAGLMETIPMVVAEPSMDHTTLAAVGDAALGLQVSGHWNADFDNPTNVDFVAGFEKAYGRVPTMYAAQGYDTALVIASALRKTGGRVDDTASFRKAMLAADFQLTRGAFAFGPNQHPIQDWWGMTVEAGPAGKPVLKTRGKILTSQSDPYASQCKLPAAP